MIVAFSTTSAMARPNNNHYRPQVNHYNTYYKHKSKNNFALGMATGILGTAIIGSIANNHYNSAPQYISTPTIYTPPASQNCITTINSYNGSTTTTCTSTPQVREVIYIR